MITYGLSATARVSNELGAGHPTQAKNAMAVTLKLSILLALAIILALALGHNICIASFSSNSLIIQEGVNAALFETSKKYTKGSFVNAALFETSKKYTKGSFVNAGDNEVVGGRCE
ncbi:hypothetical protein V6N13_125112 [Hibiscus sabdariffa]|uniref:Uncharacterized protein n=1 Tax=Hibiscus sabdariffa TaxID=183260 RepID=A0ABR2U5K6_9ROSI